MSGAQHGVPSLGVHRANVIMKAAALCTATMLPGDS